MLFRPFRCVTTVAEAPPDCFEDTDESLTEPSPAATRDGPRGAFRLPTRRDVAPTPVEAVADADVGASDELDPVDPADPVVSANATGIATIAAVAEPTPNATARAPTRPTNLALPDLVDCIAAIAGLVCSIKRTRPFDKRL